MIDSIAISTPADTHIMLLKSSPEPQADAINQQWYQSTVRSLMYTMVLSRASVRYGAGRGGFSLARPRPYTGPGGVFLG